MQTKSLTLVLKLSFVLFIYVTRQTTKPFTWNLNAEFDRISTITTWRCRSVQYNNTVVTMLCAMSHVIFYRKKQNRYSKELSLSKDWLNGLSRGWDTECPSKRRGHCVLLHPQPLSTDAVTLIPQRFWVSVNERVFQKWKAYKQSRNAPWTRKIELLVNSTTIHVQDVKKRTYTKKE